MPSGAVRMDLTRVIFMGGLRLGAVRRVLDHFIAHRFDGEAFRDYVVRQKVETFRALTLDLAKPAELFPDMYQDWGDQEAYSLQLGRGECAA